MNQTKVGKILNDENLLTPCHMVHVIKGILLS